MPLITATDVEEGLRRAFTEQEMASVTADIAQAVSTLEAWLRRKLVQTTITDERHLLSVHGHRPFLKWGDPAGVVEVKHRSRNNRPSIYDADDWMDLHTFPYWGGGNVFVTYTTDQSEVDHYLPQINTILNKAVVGRLMLPDVVKYGVLSSYSVEGTSITYGIGSQGGDNKALAANINTVDLTPLLPLRRTLVV